MKKIIPYYDKIEIQPLRKETLLLNEGQNLEEIGKVISVGSKVKFVKPGDVILFSNWGCVKVMVDDKEHFIVPDSSEFILGKINVAKK